MTNQSLRHAAPSLGGVFGSAEYDAHEQVAHFHDHATGLRAIIAVHSTALGPGLGGARFRPYAGEADALDDVLRLSHAMSYKAALAGLDLGGGKAVLLGDPARDKPPAVMRAFGGFVEALSPKKLDRMSLSRPKTRNPCSTR